MALIGMTEAARRAGVTRDGIRRALQQKGYPVAEISPRFYAIEEAELLSYLRVRGEVPKGGRPRKAQETHVE